MRLLRFLVVITILLPGCFVGRGVFALTPSDPFFSQQQYLERIGAVRAWDTTIGNPKSIVAILDVGVDIDHPDLAQAIWTNPHEIAGNGIDDDRNGFIDDVHGWDFLGKDNDPSPAMDVPNSNPSDLHHGTIVAGIIAARGNNGEGIAGIDWLAEIMPLRVLHSDGSGSVDDVLVALRYAIDNGATIVNLSFVGDETNFQFDDLLRDAAAKGVIVVAAGGNEDRHGRGDLDQFPAYPICAGNGGEAVIGVAATTLADTKASFSSFGRCVDLAAPGERIAGTLFQDANHQRVPVGGRVDATTFAGAYGGFFSGTSFAAPIVAGTASLVRGILPKASPIEVLALLERTADPFQGLDPFITGKLGAGRVNAARAVEEATASVAAIPSATSLRVDVTKSLATLGESVEVRVTLQSALRRPIALKGVELRPERANDSVTPTLTVTDGQGIARFSLHGSSEGIAPFSVFVDGVRIGGDRVVFAAATSAPIGVGSLLRGSASTVYMISTNPNDNVTKRYAFPDAQTFRSWHADTSQVQRVPDAVLAAFPLGGIMGIRPGTFLIKIQSDPKVYAIEAPGILRWIPTEVVATQIYGQNWAHRVVDVPVTSFASYAGIGAVLDGTIPPGDNHTSIYPSGVILEDAAGNRCLTGVSSCRPFVSIIAFLKNGYQQRDVLRVSTIPLPLEAVPIGDGAIELDLTMPVL